VQTVLVQFKEPGPTPSVEEVRRLLDLNDDELDTKFGVIQPILQRVSTRFESVSLRANALNRLSPPVSPTPPRACFLIHEVKPSDRRPSHCATLIRKALAKAMTYQRDIYPVTANAGHYGAARVERNV
jgi:hypothetical protein